VKHSLICALALCGIAASAQAADLDLGSLKDPLPDSLTFKGVTVYGVIDVGYAYQTNGAPLSGSLATGLNYMMFGANTNRQPISSLSNSGLSQSFVGVKVEESLGAGWTALARVESGFNPLSGELSDGCASMARQNGLNAVQQTANSGDSSRCGQFFNGPAYAGLSNAAYGTLTIGRQNSLVLELMGNYDPLALSYAFSLIGFSGGAGGGVGDTEASRWDNSIKYTYQYGPVHGSFMYANGDQDTAIHRDAYAASAGATWHGISVDVAYTRENSVISGAPLGYAGTAGTLAQAVGAGGFTINKTLNAIVSDNEAWTVGGKYTFDMGGGCGMKDDCSGGKLTLFAGYQHTDFANPESPVGSTAGNGSNNNGPGFTTIGGYQLFAINNNKYTTDKILQTAWAGAKYELPSGWSFTGAYYHADQNSWVANNAACNPHSAGSANAGIGKQIGSNCAGNFDMGSFLVDYAFNKHFDVYAGVNYSVVDGGLSSGFLQTDSTLFMTGMRLRF
jgi:predicted porin